MKIIDVLESSIKVTSIFMPRSPERELILAERENLIKVANEKYPFNKRSKVFETVFNAPRKALGYNYEIKFKINVYEEEV